jgi:hypothetical protein
MASRVYYAYPAHYVDQDVVDWANRRLLQRRDTHEFRPRWVVSIEESELDSLLYRIGQSSGELNKVRMMKGEGSAVVEKWTPREIVLRSDFPGGATLHVSQFYFPGWFVRVDDAVEASAVTPSKPGGLIEVQAPAGQHRLTLRLGERRPELAGQLISGVALLVFAALIFSKRKLHFVDSA